MLRAIAPFWPLLLTMLLSSCARIALHPKATELSPLGDRRVNYQRGNIAPQGELWRGDRCLNAQGTLKLEANINETALCQSPLFPISAGHYEFSLLLKVSGLDLSSARHLNEAFSIRLRLFDEDGNELNPERKYLGQLIDASELNYSLNRIDNDNVLSEEGRTLIRLVPRYYPYDSGWIPLDAVQATIEISIIGPGEVSLSDISLKYSKWNFTLLERLKESSDNLSPAPQHIEWKTPLLVPSDRYKSLCFNGHSTLLSVPSISLAIESLIENVEGRDKLIRIGKGANCFSINLSLTTSGHLEGYTITPAEYGVDLSSRSERGLLYALQTLSQLIEPEGRDLIRVKLATVRDWPTFTLRAVSSKDSRGVGYLQELSAASWLEESRFNTLLLELDKPAIWPSTQRIRKRIAQIVHAAPLLDIGVLYHPYAPRSWGETNEVIFSNSQSVRSIIAQIESLVLLGLKELVIRMDDFPPRIPNEKFGYVLESPQDKETFRSLAKAHADFIQRVRNLAKVKFPKLKISFVPPWYNNLFFDLSKGKGQEYLKELSALLPADTPFYWTGPTVRSLFIDKPHIERFRSLIGKRPIVLWDNTLYARRHKDFWGKRPERMQLNSLFEPYEPSLAPLLTDSLSGVMLNGSTTELMRIQLATAGAYLWNPLAYDPEEALFNYLTSRFGKELALGLLEFDSALWSVRAAEDSDKCLRLSNLKEKWTKLEKLPTLLRDELREIFQLEVNSHNKC